MEAFVASNVGPEVSCGSSGNFVGNRGYLRLHFETGGQLHYGFADIQVNGLNSATPFDLRLYSVSYESVTGLPAVVAVPELSSAVLVSLFILAGCLMLLLNAMRFHWGGSGNTLPGVLGT